MNWSLYDTRVTGISNSLMGSNDFTMHAIIFDPTNKKLFYMIVDMSSSINVLTTLYDEIDYIRESYFAGTSLGTSANSQEFFQ